MSDIYDIGDTVRLSASFTGADGTAADPTTATVSVLSPSGTVTTSTPLKDAVGSYHHDTLPDASGTWSYRFAGTGAVTAAREGAFYVRQQQVVG